jgi:hypothetical protein
MVMDTERFVREVSSFTTPAGKTVPVGGLVYLVDPQSKVATFTVESVWDDGTVTLTHLYDGSTHYHQTSELETREKEQT